MADAKPKPQPRTIADLRKKRGYLLNNEVGINQQKMYREVISNKMGIPLLETADNEKYGQYFFYDWYNPEETIFVEYKRRKINKDRYNTTILTHDKFSWAGTHPEQTFLYIFAFTDGLYYIHYKDIPPTTYRVCVSGNGYTECVIDIPTELLRPIADFTWDSIHDVPKEKEISSVVSFS
jgi:hypothetical protein